MFISECRGEENRVWSLKLALPTKSEVPAFFTLTLLYRVE